LGVAASLMAAAGNQQQLSGPVASVHSFVKMPGLEVASAQGQSQHALCSAAMGVSFAAGTTDGPGMFDFTQGSANSSNPFWRFIGSILHEASDAQKACQHPKAILLDIGSISLPYPWADDTVPLQLLRVGQLVIAAVPTEMTTMAGRRTRAALRARLVANGVLSESTGVVVLAGLANGYADYTTTREEFSQQRYEGGSTIYGPLQLDGYIQELLRLADHLANGTTPSSDSPPEDFTGHVISTGGSKEAEAAPSGHAFGDVLLDAPASVAPGGSVAVTFVGGSLNNDLHTQSSFLRVERQAAGGGWDLIAEDGDVETRLTTKKDGWLLSDKHYEVTATWDVPPATPAGTYRISHQGSWWHDPLFSTARAVPYSGASSAFQVAVPQWVEAA